MSSNSETNDTNNTNDTKSSEGNPIQNANIDIDHSRAETFNALSQAATTAEEAYPHVDDQFVFSANLYKTRALVNALVYVGDCIRFAAEMVTQNYIINKNIDRQIEVVKLTDRQKGELGIERQRPNGPSKLSVARFNNPPSNP